MEEPRRRTAVQCRRALRKAVIVEFDDLIEGFLKEARKGSCAHIKFAVDLLRPEPRADRSSGDTGVMQRLLEELERDAVGGYVAVSAQLLQPQGHSSESFLV